MEKAIQIMNRGPLGIAKEGFPFIGLGLILTVVGFLIFLPIGLSFLALTVFCLYFFRDPQRLAPKDIELLLSPADGKVLKVETLSANDRYPEEHTKISIFMSALNVHVNRIPCDGVVTKVQYHPGDFFVASLDKASERNERNSVFLETPQNQKVVFTQIAGLVARRIVCYLQPEATVRRGQRYGLIRFGSRMEVSFPKHWEVMVRPGQKVQGVLSPLAKMVIP